MEFVAFLYWLGGITLVIAWGFLFFTFTPGPPRREWTREGRPGSR